MTLTAEQPDPETQAPPADDAPSGDESPETPAPADPSEGPSSASEADAKVTALTAELAVLRDKADKSEKRIPGLQALISKREQERDGAMTEARTFRNSMLEWTRDKMIRNGLEDEWKEIERNEQERTGKVLVTQASRAETMEVINDLLDSDESGDREFGRFLRTQVKAATEGGVPVKVTKQNLGTYRQMFASARGEAAPAAHQPQTAAPAAPSVAQRKPLPKVLGASGAPATTEEPAYKPGDKPSDLFTRYFRRKDGAEA